MSKYYIVFLRFISGNYSKWCLQAQTVYIIIIALAVKRKAYRSCFLSCSAKTLDRFEHTSLAISVETPYIDLLMVKEVTVILTDALLRSSKSSSSQSIRPALLSSMV
jgi:hypothetical protein